ncbi:MAG: 2Fe-2S iron-sulfur cluster-binding protein [Gallionella sp.]
MGHLLPLSRVAKLIGISRHQLQEMIRGGLLATFDGMVELEEMLRAFPGAQWEDDAEFRRVSEIKEKAFGKRIFERAMPDKEVLAQRLNELSMEYAASKAMLMHYQQVFSWLDEKINEIADDQNTQTRQSMHALKRMLDRHLSELPADAATAQAAIARERISKIMSAQVTIRPSGHEFFVEGNDTLLEAALRAGVSLEYGCSNGNCGNCRARLVSGNAIKVRAHDYVLRQEEKDAGIILLCSSTAVDDVVIDAHVAGAGDIEVQQIETKVKTVEVLNGQIAALHLVTPRSQRLRFLAGQSIRVGLNGVSGIYPIASCPCEDRQIEVHIPRIDGNQISEAVFNSVKANDHVEIEGPYGDFVLEESSSNPVIFIAFGMGFAPIKSLIQHAMSLDMAERIDLHWIADQSSHYQNNLCRSWSDALDNFSYFPHHRDNNADTVLDRIVAIYSGLDRYHVYVSGNSQQVSTTRQRMLEQGLPPEQWHEGIIEV